MFFLFVLVLASPSFLDELGVRGIDGVEGLRPCDWNVWDQVAWKIWLMRALSVSMSCIILLLWKDYLDVDGWDICAIVIDRVLDGCIEKVEMYECV
jgi:hypothetical protein